MLGLHPRDDLDVLGQRRAAQLLAEPLVDLEDSRAVGHLDLDASTAATGNITKNGTLFLHHFGGAFNTFLGEDAGNFTMTGANNTGVGRAALTSNTTGGSNTAMGLSALFSNTTGPMNAAFGWWWADPVAGLGMLPWLTREGLEGIRGDECCGCGN